MMVKINVAQLLPATGSGSSGLRWTSG